MKFLRIVSTPKFSTRLAASLDIAATLLVEHIGYTYKLPFWHPAILLTVGGLTFALFRWKDEISSVLVGGLGPLQNKNRYSFRRDHTVKLNRLVHESRNKRRARSGPILLVESQTVN